jgi:hypothetical protein
MEEFTMTSINRLLLLLAITLALCAVSLGADGAHRTIIYDGVVTDIGPSAIDTRDAADLWITTADLTRATKFVIKPQGVCRDELCFPIPKDRKDRLVARQGRDTIFNLSEFARMVHQPVAVDQKNSVWFFGARQAAQNDFVQTLQAPNFTLPDLSGKMHSLSDFRGKKVVLITWASW